MTRYKIGVFGSGERNVAKAERLAKSIGRELGKQKVVVITGACSGLPYVVAKEAHAHGAKIWGFSPETSLRAHRTAYPNDDDRVYAKLIFVPRTYSFATYERVTKKYRNVTSTATCDAGIIIAGRWGSLNEFTNLYDMGKVVGVLMGSGGVADELPRLLKKIHKPGKAVVVCDTSPIRLVKKVMRELSKRH